MQASIEQLNELWETRRPQDAAAMQNIGSCFPTVYQVRSFRGTAPPLLVWHGLLMLAVVDDIPPNAISWRSLLCTCGFSFVLMRFGMVQKIDHSMQVRGYDPC